MKFSLAKEQKDFFEQKGMLEIEGMISSSQLEILNALIDHFLKKEASSQRRTLESVDPFKFFLAGYDLWRKDVHIKKILFHKRISEAAVELNFRAPFRIAYDQFIPANLETNMHYTLAEISSFQGILFGYILCLKASNHQESSNPAANPFSLHPGNIVFIHPDFSLDYSLLKEREGCEYILVTYAKDKTLYTFKENNVQTHVLKKYGYVFGDRIREETHPIIYRS